jgi:PAS domain S-box-containing protein
MVPDTEPINRKILIIDNDSNLHETIRGFLSHVEQHIEPGTTPEFEGVSRNAEYSIISSDRGEPGVQLAAEAEMSGRPFALTFIGETIPPDLTNLDIAENIWRDSPDMEIVLIISDRHAPLDAVILQSSRPDQLLVTRRPLMASGIRQLALSLTGKWTYRQSMRQACEKTWHEQKRRQCELENAVLRLQKEIIVQRRKLEIIEDKFTRYKNIFDQTDCPLVVTSGRGNRPFGKILDANHSFYRLTGYNPMELKNMEFDNIFDEDVVASAAGSGLCGSLKTRTADIVPVEIKSRRISAGQDKLVIAAAFVAVFQPVI